MASPARFIAPRDPQGLLLIETTTLLTTPEVLRVRPTMAQFTVAMRGLGRLSRLFTKEPTADALPGFPTGFSFLNSMLCLGFDVLGRDLGV